MMRISSTRMQTEGQVNTYLMGLPLPMRVDYATPLFDFPHGPLPYGIGGINFGAQCHGKCPTIIFLATIELGVIAAYTTVAGGPVVATIVDPEACLINSQGWFFCNTVHHGPHLPAFGGAGAGSFELFCGQFIPPNAGAYCHHPNLSPVFTTLTITRLEVFGVVVWAPSGAPSVTSVHVIDLQYNG